MSLCHISLAYYQCIKANSFSAIHHRFVLTLRDEGKNHWSQIKRMDLGWKVNKKDVFSTFLCTRQQNIRFLYTRQQNYSACFKAAGVQSSKGGGATGRPLVPCRRRQGQLEFEWSYKWEQVGMQDPLFN